MIVTEGHVYLLEQVHLCYYLLCNTWSASKTWHPAWEVTASLHVQKGRKAGPMEIG